VIAIHDGRGEGGNGTRTADDGNIALASRIVQSADARDELSPVGKVDVVAASFNGGSSDPVILLLERSCGMDEDLGTALLQNASEVAPVGIHRKRLLGAETELLDGFERAIVVAAGYQQPNGWISREARANAMPEESVAAQNENRVQRDPPRILRSQGGR
jgi:hypothetical protein